MDDPILNSYLNEFSKSYGLNSLPEPEIFEYFSAYCVMHRDFSERTELNEVVVSGGLDTGIDSAAIFLNDIHVTTPAQVTEIASRQRVEAEFVFIQSKTSRSLNAAEIGSYLQGIKEFFGQRYMPANDSITALRELSDSVFKESVKFKSKPLLHLYYCYAGRFRDDPVATARKQAGIEELKNYGLFADVFFTFVDADRLQERYQEVNLRIEREIQMNEFASLPQIPGIRQAYLGLLQCKELVKLLSNSDGMLHKAIFNENVRDFLSSNPVNDEISATIASPTEQSKLAALNNGITIVARDVRLVGKKFTLADYQIVNGCQTSNIIFNNRNKILDDTAVPVKIIEVEDRDIVNDIVRATNRQTEVKDEAFVVLGDFHKKLERFLLSIDEPQDKKIVYERRKRQYADTLYTPQNIISLTSLTNAFVSCYIEDPVSANDYYGVLLKKYNGKIFIEEHSMWPYLLSAKILRGIEKLCTGSAKKNLWKFRFIIALLVRRSFGGKPILSNDVAQRKYAQLAIDKINRPDHFIPLVINAERKIAAAVGIQGAGFDARNAHQDRKFVSSLLIN
ncbi:AIPR family protein [Magnetospirillum fulvum]|uniref:AIPR protein n=1 Tax=Magnetospirillum fulvum TaxID=1082 RepID=A0A1H6K0E5_MAGFU|nr:AIPR family protein [Magnetospirillum fulvum]SEH65037.1 AIPR protein [Magnetospirillum fulvum]